jgi:hypothetical protein
LGLMWLYGWIMIMYLPAIALCKWIKNDR